MKTLLTDYRISPKSEEKLRRLGYKIIKTVRQNNVHPAVCGHPDMFVCKLRENDLVVSPEYFSYLREICSESNIICGASELSADYPYDIAYNCALVGNNLICNEKYTDRKILEYCVEKGIKILNTKQGYAKCSTCVVTDNSIITADKNICAVAKKNNIDVLLIKNDGIILEGLNEGFIGGATGLIEDDLLAVNGNVGFLEDSDRIIGFCEKYGVKVLALSDERVTDIGTIIRLP